MDNASKALIIAGAVLIAVMLVSVGVMVYNRATEGIGSALDSMDATSSNGFNATFNSYLEVNLTRSNAVRLVDAVISNNKKNDERQVNIAEGTTGYKTLSEARQAALPSEPSSIGEESAFLTLRQKINAQKNSQFYANAHKDVNGHIDNITIYVINRGGNWENGGN